MKLNRNTNFAYALRSRWAAAPIPPEKKLSKEASVTLTIQFFFTFGAAMSGLFLNLYLWRLTHSLSINAMYQIISFAVGPLGFALGGWLNKKKDRMVTYRAGIALTALFYLVVIMAKSSVVTYFPLFAVCGGLASAFYWAGYLTLMYDVSTVQNRIRFLAFNMISFTAASLVGPALAGLIIRYQEGLRGYSIVFGIAFVMFVIAALVSMKIRAKESRRRRYFLKFTGLVMSKHRNWSRALFAFLIFGMLQGIMLFLPNILLFQVMPREDIVGYLGVLYSSVTIMTGMAISRYAREKYVKVYMTVATVGYIAGSLILMIQISLGTVIAFMVLYSIFNPLQGNTLTSNYFGLMDSLPLKGELRVESVVVRETFVNIGRILAISILMLAADGVNSPSLPWVILCASAVQAGLAYLLKSKDAGHGKEISGGQ